MKESHSLQVSKFVAQRTERSKGFAANRIFEELYDIVDIYVRRV